ncbi:HNH endonuclease [Polaromonas sp.]|uniref:HNH endonuclease n=1 Tax=Polaromonas sp. TaxID=1869339 RepID=UPI003752F5DE
MSLQRLKPRLATLNTQRLTAQPLETQRLRGSAAVKRRSTFLERNPLCAECSKQGRVHIAQVPDHRIPLWAGGADDLETNGNPLCFTDHDAKTKCEARMRAAGGWMSTPCQCGQHEG